jgi:chemotaxis protein methyltransferase CheR
MNASRSSSLARRAPLSPRPEPDRPRDTVVTEDSAPVVSLGNPFKLTTADFEQLRRFIFEHTGISLSDHKRALVYSRLARRLRHHRLSSYAEYYTLLTQHDPQGVELVEMINAITTNKTSFFRESHHFTFMTEQLLPQLRAGAQRGAPRSLRVWSAASSTGEEPYTIAMVARDGLPESEGWRIEISATDIDTSVLARAEQGVYAEELSDEIPAPLLHKYFLRGKGGNRGYVMAGPQLKSIVRFQRLNLVGTQWPWQEPFDIVFCRNVLIYFNKDTQRDLVRRMIAHIRPGGYLMLGHSEFLHGNVAGIEHLRKNIYRVPERSK